MTFASCKSLRNISLPEGVEFIGQRCFNESGIESIRLPSTLRAVEQYTFQLCKNLKRVVLPDGLEVIGRRAFRDTGLTQVRLPSSLRDV